MDLSDNALVVYKQNAINEYQHYLKNPYKEKSEVAYNFLLIIALVMEIQTLREKQKQ